MIPDNGIWQRMADSLDAITAMFAVSALEIGKPYKDSCPARKDDNGQRQLACDWQQRPVDELHAEIQSQLAQANDHLRILARALTEPRIIYSPFTLARGTLIPSAQAFHLCDPRISLVDRIGRLLNFHYTSNLLLRTMVDGGPSTPDPAERARLDQVIDELARSAQQLGLTIKYPKNDTSKAPVYFGHPFPKDIELVGELLGEGDASGHGEFAFRLFSAGVHAQPHLSSILTTQTVGAGREGMIPANRAVTTKTLAAIATAAAGGYMTACERAMAYFGVESSTSRMASAMAILVELSELGGRNPNRTAS
ncbi:hypothetical protein [Nocardia noduli]|uniref:hypothetical protein n=1 Tax=Nocardia noduli TaxID=2815722 RepID=UPI001C22E276|nr:hypothetical protein [Nocardia noduli]